MHILIVEPDNKFQDLLKVLLSRYQLTFTDSSKAALHLANQTLPDMVLLEVDIDSLSGYEVCQQIRLNTEAENIPIIFLTSRSMPENRLKAYDAGGTDFIGKPFDVVEFIKKIDSSLNVSVSQKELKQSLLSSHQLVRGMQISTSKMQSISRFIQATLFVHDIDTLGKYFFKTAKEIDLDCVLRIESNTGIRTLSSDSQVSTLEEEILKMASKVERIHTFGKDRAIYHWKHATLLTRNVGEMVDTIAIFMDALDAGIKAVDTEVELLEQVGDLENTNTLVQQRVDELFDFMNIEIKDTILSLGLVSGLDVEDEDKLNDILDIFSQRIMEEFQLLKSNNQSIRRLISEMRLSEENNELNDDDLDKFGVELF